MGTFRHTPDDLIFVNDYAMTLAFFQTLEPAYTLASPYTNRYYEQGRCHVISDGPTGEASEFPYVDGDTYISNVAAYIAAHTLHLNPPKTLSELKSEKILEMLVYASTIIDGGVNIGTDNFPSNLSVRNTLLSEEQSATRVGSVPVGYYVNDMSGDPVATNLAELIVILDRIIELRYITRVNSDTHRHNILALVTEVDVAAYDFTGGWATVPY